MKIYTKLPKLDSVEEYILSLFSNIVTSSYQSCVETYKDPECILKQCNKARRSFEDLFSIVNTVYEDTISKEEFAKIIYKLNQNNDFYTFYCEDVRKWVFMIERNSHKYVDDKHNINFYVNNLSINDYFEENGKGEYSLKDIMDLAGLKDNYEKANGEK